MYSMLASHRRRRLGELFLSIRHLRLEAGEDAAVHLADS
jgi:hypothetical protein